ncbi:MAG: hypothetical protein COA78_04145 [Blastopirellula sp.]|nr:MAG: hypothetical protein COA78_04145 [Blastopirellula sp.]
MFTPLERPDDVQKLIISPEQGRVLATASQFQLPEIADPDDYSTRANSLGLVEDEYRTSIILQPEDEKIEEQMNIQEIFGSDSLVITIKTKGAEPYQGIAPLRGTKFSEVLEYYFATSEQLATRYWLACDEKNVSGMFIQKLPGVYRQ